MILRGEEGMADFTVASGLSITFVKSYTVIIEKE